VKPAVGDHPGVVAAIERVVDAPWPPEGDSIAQFEFTPEIPMANPEAVSGAWERPTARALEAR